MKLVDTIKSRPQLSGATAIALAALTAGGGIWYVFGTQAATNGTAKLYLAPASKTVAANGEVTLEIRENSGTVAVNAVQADLAYPTNAEFVSVDKTGSAFEVEAPTANSTGLLSINRGNIQSLTGDNLVAKVTFRIKSGTADINFAGSSGIISADTNVSVLGDSLSTGGSYGVAANATPAPVTPTPTPTSTPSVTPVPVTPTPAPATPTPVPGQGGGGNTPTPAPAAEDKSAPTAPTDLKATLVTDTQISLKWDASTDNKGVAGYRIYRDDVLIATQSGTSYTDKDVDPDESYKYGVEAFDAAGNTSKRVSMTAKTAGNGGGTVATPTPEVTTPTPALGTTPAPTTEVTPAPTGGSGGGITITPPGSNPVNVPSNVKPTVGGSVTVASANRLTLPSTGGTGVAVDGDKVSTLGELNTEYLTNGDHVISLLTTDQDGNVSTTKSTVTVRNPQTPYQAARNTLFAPFKSNPTLMNIGMVLLILTVVGGIAWGLYYLLWRRNDNDPVNPDTTIRSNLS